MANKRNLKKSIQYVCTDLLSECVAATLYDGKEEKAKEIINSIILINNDYTRRISHPEPGIKVKEYFKILKSDFGKDVTEIIDNIRNMG